MSDYTPTTEEVRNFIPNDSSVWVFIAGEWQHTTREGFDRWLAEVKAQAWEEGKNSVGYEHHNPNRCELVIRYYDNPYREGADK